MNHWLVSGNGELTPLRLGSTSASTSIVPPWRRQRSLSGPTNESQLPGVLEPPWAAFSSSRRRSSRRHCSFFAPVSASHQPPIAAFEALLGRGGLSPSRGACARAEPKTSAAAAVE